MPRRHAETAGFCSPLKNVQLNLALLSLAGGASLALPFKPEMANHDPAGIEIGVRPEHVSFVDSSKDGTMLQGSVLLVERLGNLTIAYVNTEAGQIVVELGSDHDVRVGDTVGLTIDPARVTLFSSDGTALH
jgi:ABC-type sugar transport system ATPase subunit